MNKPEYLLLAEDLVRLTRELYDFHEILITEKNRDKLYYDCAQTYDVLTDILIAGGKELASQVGELNLDTYSYVYEGIINDHSFYDPNANLLPKDLKLYSRTIKAIAKRRIDWQKSDKEEDIEF